VLVLSAGGFVAQRYGIDSYVMFAICVVTIGVGSWASYEWVEKSSYRRLKVWIDGESPVEATPILSRQKY
jgi:peptidoglycan/LPS O-acetylase OafA/YrhL